MRLLVIDDEPRIGLTLTLLLEEHDVTVATNGQEAREQLGAGSFDAVLCDLMLDDTNGAELTEWIAKNVPEMSERVVMMTGGALTEEAHALMRDHPPERWLEKPFTAQQIRAALDRIA